MRGGGSESLVKRVSIPSRRVGDMSLLNLMLLFSMVSIPSRRVGDRGRSLTGKQPIWSFPSPQGGPET